MWPDRGCQARHSRQSGTSRDRGPPWQPCHGDQVFPELMSDMVLLGGTVLRMMLQGGAPIVAVDGHVEDAGVVREDLLRAVAKVHIPVQDDYPPCACLLRSPGRHPCSTIAHINTHEASIHMVNRSIDGSPLSSTACKCVCCSALVKEVFCLTLGTCYEAEDFGHGIESVPALLK